MSFLVLVRSAFYVIVALVVGSVWRLFESVEGNGGKDGLRWILMALFVTWASIALATFGKLCGVGSDITVWSFVGAGVITLYCMVKLVRMKSNNSATPNASLDEF